VGKRRVKGGGCFLGEGGGGGGGGGLFLGGGGGGGGGERDCRPMDPFNFCNKTLQKMLSLIAVMFQMQDRFPHDKLCDHL